MVTRLMYTKKEVGTPLNKMKHNSPLQRHVFLPLTCRIFKKKKKTTISPLFVMIDKGYKKQKKTSPEKHKDDQGGIRNPYKFMNVMK